MQLPADPAARLLLPGPDPLDERRAPDLRGGCSPSCSSWRSTTIWVAMPGVVGAGLPEHRPAAHPPEADQRVLDRVVERVPHVQAAGDVRRRHDDAVGLALGIGRRPEMAARLPQAVVLGLDLGRSIGLVQHRRAVPRRGCSCTKPAPGRRVRAIGEFARPGKLRACASARPARALQPIRLRPSSPAARASQGRACRPMDPLIFALVLGAALLHASWNALVKTGGDPFLRLAVVNLVAGLCALPLLFVAGTPAARQLAVPVRLDRDPPRLLSGARLRLSPRRPVARLSDRPRHRTAARGADRLGVRRRKPGRARACSRSW